MPVSMRLQDLVRHVNRGCVEAEQDRKLSAGAIGRRRAEICDPAIIKLVNFKSFKIAEKAVNDNIGSPEQLTERDAEQTQMYQKLTKALADLREGVDATRRMVLERCRMRAGVFV